MSEDCLTLNVWAVLSRLLAGGGNDPSLSEVDGAVKHLLFAARQIGLVAWASGEQASLRSGNARQAGNCFSMPSRSRCRANIQASPAFRNLGRRGFSLTDLCSGALD